LQTKTLGQLLEDPSELFDRIKKLFPAINWEEVALDGAEIRDTINDLKAEISGNERAWSSSLESWGGLDFLIDVAFEWYISHHPQSNSPIVQLTHAVQLTFTVITMMAALTQVVVIVRNRPDINALIERFKDQDNWEEVEPERWSPRPSSHIPVNSHGEIIN
jgi:hypothetical protein